MSEGQYVEQGSRNRQAGKADKDDRNHRMPDENDVAAKGLADMLVLDHGHDLTLQGESCSQDAQVILAMNHKPHNLYVKKCVKKCRSCA